MEPGSYTLRPTQWLTVANGAWVRMLTEARERHPDETETWVTCISVTDEEARGKGLEGSAVSNANER
jgi:hypothetical protein